MHHPRKRMLAAALVAAALLVPLAAHAQGDVTVDLTARRVVTDARGHETLLPADQAKPGEVVEYAATYRNPGPAGARQVMATLPIPTGMEYVPETAQPAAVLASLDGRNFEPVPLQRKVRLADGRQVLRPVPVSEYRYLRWSLGTLAGRSERTVLARLRVTPPSMATATDVRR